MFPHRITLFIIINAAISIAKATDQGASEIKESEISSCEDVHKIENETEQCSFIQENPNCETDGGYVNYAAVLYCQFQGRLRPLGFVLYALWFLYLLLATAVTSDRFFAPNLPVIADALHLSENVAGETLLALGNGAPDFFTSLVAALGMKDGDAGILYGTLLGSGIFVTTVIVATIIMIRPFHTMQRPLIKDIAFYMCAVFCAFGTLWDGVIYLWEAIMFLVIYVVYLIFVLSGPYINRLLIKWAKKRRLAKIQTASESDTTVPSTLTSPDSQGERRLTVVLESPAYELPTVQNHVPYLPNDNNNMVMTAAASNGTPKQRLSSTSSNKQYSTVEEATPQSAAIHGIINRGRAILAFTSGLPVGEQPTTSGIRARTPIFRQHSKSTSQWESQSSRNRRGTSVGSEASPAGSSNLAEIRQRRMSAWASPRRHRLSTASPLAIGSRSRRTSSRLTPDSGQLSPILPRTARLIMRRASARLNERLKFNNDNDNLSDEPGQDEEAAGVGVRLGQTKTLKARRQSRLEAFLEDDTDEEADREEYELALKRQQRKSTSSETSGGSVSKRNGATNSEIYVVPVPPTIVDVADSLQLPPSNIKTECVENRKRAMSVGNRQFRQLRFAEDGDTASPVHSLRISIERPTDETLHDQEGEIGHDDAYQRPEEEIHPEGQSEEETEEEFDTVEDKPYWKWILEGYNPIEMEEWEKQNWFGKLVQVLKAPIIFVMLITNPALDEDKPIFNWNRPVNCLHCIVSPIFVILAILEFEVMLGGKFPLIVLFAIIGAVASLAVFFTSSNIKRPKYHLAFAALGFVTTVIWIYVLANEIVNLLQCFGLALNISQSILGLTCLAWGNSLGDLINNVIIAKQGYSKMAISSCFGGMLFNLLLGLGVPLLIATAKSGGIVHIAQSNVLTVLFGFLGLELVSSFIAIPIIQRFYVRRPYAIYLYAVYACCIVFAVLTEADVIAPNIFRYAYIPV